MCDTEYTELFFVQIVDIGRRLGDESDYDSEKLEAVYGDSSKRNLKDADGENENAEGK